MSSGSDSKVVVTAFKKQRSKFGKHFILGRDERNERTATCIECLKDKITKVIKRKDGNTSGLKKHLVLFHQDIYAEIYGTAPETSQPTPTPPKRPKIEKEIIVAKLSSKPISSSSEPLDNEIVRWMMSKKLPINFFEDQQTQHFFSLLNPNITLPSADTTKSFIMTQFKKEHEKIEAIIANNPSMVSFTIDSWISPRNSASYYAIAIHFISADWKPQSIVLDFIPLKSFHSGKKLAKLFWNCVQNYSLENKIQAITLDNTAANSDFINELATIMENSEHPFEIENRHFRCFAQLLNVSVLEALKATKMETVEYDASFCCFDESSENEESDEDSDCEESISRNLKEEFSAASAIRKLRSTFRKIRRSDDVQNIFKMLCDLSNTTYVKPIIDVKTKWNTTYDMIGMGIKMKNALHLLWLNREDVVSSQLSEEEWSFLKQIHSFLADLKIILKMIRTEKYAALPLVVVAINMLLSKMESNISKLMDKSDRNNVDDTLLLAFEAGRDKIREHYKFCNWIYCAVLILDPRHKVETFSKTEWGKEMEANFLETFKSIFYQCYYDNDPLNTTDGNRSRNESMHENMDVIDVLSLFESSNKTDEFANELEEYLAMPRADKDVDILNWWKLWSPTFPCLSRMAKDYLSIMATSVPVEKLMTQTSLLMDQNRNASKDESVKALLCLNSWLGESNDFNCDSK